MQAIEVMVVLVMVAGFVVAMVLVARWGAGVDAGRAGGGNTAGLLEAQRCGNAGCREVVRVGARYCTRCGGRLDVGEPRAEG